jgi:hypothetical protein
MKGERARDGIEQGVSNEKVEETKMNRTLIKALATSVLVAFTAGAQAQETVVWWDFLGGGDGARMKKLIEDFNAANAGQIEIQATTLDWAFPSTPRCRPRPRSAKART